MGDRGRHRPDGGDLPFLLAGWRLYRLGVIARAIVPAAGHAPGGVGLGRRFVGLWWRLSAASTLLFVVQENVEHQRVGEGLPGLAVLGSAEYPDAALVIAGVALVVALVGALFLLATRCPGRTNRLGPATRDTCGRVAPSADRSSFATGRPDSPVGRGLGVRAPPLPAR